MVGCPGCGSKLVFDIESQQMKCSYCGKLYVVSQVSKHSKSADEHPDMTRDEYSEEPIMSEGPVMEATVFTCSQCGAEIVADPDEAVTWCSYCGSPATLKSRLSMIRKPDKVIPFKITKKECALRYREVARKQIYAPNDLIRKGKAESFRGIYMPFWSYNVSRSGEYRFPGKTVEVIGNEQITTSYMANGWIESRQHDLSHDASVTFDDAVSEKIVPFMGKDAVEFDDCYLNGFYANAADQGEEEYRQNILSTESDIIITKAQWNLPKFGMDEQAAKQQLADTGNYKISMESSLQMYPVWFLSYRHGDRVSYATINGQTGKTYADFPASPYKYLLFSLLTAIPLYLLINLVMSATPAVVMFSALIAAFVASSIYQSEVTEIFVKQFHVSFGKKEKIAAKLKKAFTGFGTVAMIFVYVVLYLLFDTNEYLPDLGANFDYVYMVIAAILLVILVIRFFKMKSRFMALSNVRLNMTNGLFVLVAVISLAMFIIRPADDYLYYAGGFAAAAIVALSVVNLIHGYNILASQKPKQFKRSGGDDLA
ncbi:MAG: hypothetical protein J5643_05930 [Lachnospiraceae bacterium]|nr:hypothetical protein [Lachnospiraceae bacterium]